jgi:TetR/AcrR family transcriptional regulator
MNSWWERVGSTRASGITKLMMSEAKNFPDLAAFYQQEVIKPGQNLIRRILQRGMDRGELKPLDLDYAVYAIIAPMIYLTLSRHSGSICVSDHLELDAQRFLKMQVDTILYGMSAAAQPSAGAA